MRRHYILVTLVFCTLAVASAAAQERDPAPAPLPRQPIAAFVVDARIPFPRFKENDAIAAGLGVDKADLPVRGIGLLGGAHVYPLRRGSFALGFGAEMLRARASETKKAADNVPNAVDGPTVKTRWTQFSPQVSLNFGSREGYSYLTVGIGKSKLTTELEDDPQPDPESSVSTLNYGGGARWFIKKHLAFNLDLRFYSISEEDAATTPGRTPNPQMRLLVFGAGVSIR